MTKSSFLAEVTFNKTPCLLEHYYWDSETRYAINIFYFNHCDTSSYMILIFNINDINIHDINFVIKKLLYEKLALAESKDQRPPVLTELRGYLGRH